MASPSTVFADRYELIREIARGGMADVYLARDSKLDRLCRPDPIQDGLQTRRADIDGQQTASLLAGHQDMSFMRSLAPRVVTAE